MPVKSRLLSNHQQFALEYACCHASHVQYILASIRPVVCTVTRVMLEHILHAHEIAALNLHSPSQQFAKAAVFYRTFLRDTVSQLWS